MPKPVLALLTLSSMTLAQGAPDWTFGGRQLDRRSTSATELLVDFSLQEGESPVQAVVNCVQATRRAYAKATYVYCAAFTPTAYQHLSGRLRLCYSATAHWFGGEAPYYRLHLPGDDPRYPRSCLDPA